MPRSIEVYEGEKSLAYITPPVAYDADGQSVPTTAEIDGDRVVVNVEHRSRAYRYPIHVDPITGDATSAYVTYSTTLGSEWQPQTDGASFYGYANGDPAFGYGLVTAMPKNTSYPPSGTAGAWRFVPPANTKIYQAVFGNHMHSAYTLGSYILSATATGITGPGGWAPGYGYVDQAGNRGGNPFGAYYASYSGVTQTFLCQSSPCSSFGSAAWFYLFAANRYNAATIMTGNQVAYNRMQWAMVYLTDDSPPQITNVRRASPADAPDAGLAPNEQWQDGAASTSVLVDSTDVGVGMRGITVTGATSPRIDFTNQCNAPPPCSKGEYLSYTRNEGINTITATPVDKAGKSGAPRTWTEKIDRNAPTVSLTGALVAADGGQLAAGQSYPLNISATDTGTGVASISVLLDGDQDSAVTGSCGPNGGCPLSHTYTLAADGLAAGTHSVTVQATDVYGHSATQKTITFTTPGTPPSDTDPNVGDETTDTPASPTPTTPGGPATSSQYTSDLWMPEDTNTDNGAYVVTSTDADKTALTGTAINQSTSDPIQGAAVTLSYIPCSGCAEASVATTTDSQGAYAFVAMPASKYKLTVAASGLGSWTATNDTFEAGESYYKQAAPTDTAQTYDESEKPDGTAKPGGLARAAAAGDPNYTSLARVPPYVRVAEPALGDKCQALTPISSAKVTRYPFEFYLQGVITQEVQVVNYNEKGLKAFAQMAQNFAWYHATQRGKWDVDSSTGDQCFKPHFKASSTWHRWLNESTLRNRITQNKGSALEEAGFRSGNPDLACSDPAVDAGKPLFVRNGGIASQWLIDHEARSQCDSSDYSFPTWQSIVRYWDAGTLDYPALAPPRPTVSNGSIDGTKGGVTFGFKSGTERGYAWHYSIQKRIGTGSDTRWVQIKRIDFSRSTRTVPTSYTYETNTTQAYRVRAFSPAGSSSYVSFNDGLTIQPG